MSRSKTYLAVWKERVEADSGSPFFITKDKSHSYGDIWRRLKHITSRLQSVGIKEGDYAALRIENGLHTAELILAMPLIGAVSAAINRYLSDGEIREILSGNPYAYFICDKQNSDFSALTKQIEKDKIFDTAGGERDFSAIEYDAEKPVTLIFSSGSSARPKAVIQTFANHYFSALGSNENIRFGAGDVWLLSLPLYHVAGQALFFRALLTAAAVRIMEMGETLGEALEDERITHISLVVTQLAELLADKSLNKRIKRLKALLVGGSAVSPKLIEEAYEREWKIYTTYGSTEMCSQVSTTPPNASLQVLKTSGKVLNYRELKIGRQGGILLRGKTLSPGYLIDGSVVDIRNNEGWYESGDLGMIDEKGLLHIKGRIDNMFISGGENIYPEVIEKAAETLTDVEKALSVPVKDEKFGYRPALFLKMKKGQTPEISQLKEMLRDKLAAYMLPVYVFSWPEQTARTGIKISRKAFKSLAEKMISEKSKK